MISYKEAIDKVRVASKLLDTEIVNINDSVRKVAAEDINAKVSNPNFDNSAMDGFAVISDDIAQASKDNPISLKIDNVIAAGDNITHLERGKICEIMTGAMIPENCDAVIKVEDVETNGNQVIFTEPAKKNENIRRKGEDFISGEIVLGKGNIITPECLMLLVSAGINKIKVYRKIKIAIISTGKELCNPKDSLQTGKIYDSNSPYLLSILNHHNVEVKYFGNIYDDKKNFIEILGKITSEYSADIIISTGAVSKGKWDFIPDSLKEAGFKTIFHKANIRPGKPILFAKSKTAYFFGLPGNPRAVTVGFRFFVYPLICKLQNLDIEKPLTAKLEKNFTKKNKLKFFVVGRVNFNEEGELKVGVLEGQESFKVKSTAIGNCFVALDEDCRKYKAGEKIEVYCFSNKKLF